MKDDRGHPERDPQCAEWGSNVTQLPGDHGAQMAPLQMCVPGWARQSARCPGLGRPNGPRGGKGQAVTPGTQQSLELRGCRGQTSGAAQRGVRPRGQRGSALRAVAGPRGHWPGGQHLRGRDAAGPSPVRAPAPGGVRGAWGDWPLPMGRGREAHLSPGSPPAADRRGGTDGQPAPPRPRPHGEAAAQAATRLQHPLPVQGPRPAANVRGECAPRPPPARAPGPASSDLSLRGGREDGEEGRSSGWGVRSSRGPLARHQPPFPTDLSSVLGASHGPSRPRPVPTRLSLCCPLLARVAGQPRPRAAHPAAVRPCLLARVPGARAPPGGDRRCPETGRQCRTVSQSPPGPS